MLVVFKSNVCDGEYKFKIVYSGITYFVFDVEEREYKKAIIRDECVKEDSLLAIIFLKNAMTTKEKQEEKYESYIASNHVTAYAYAVYVLKERFILGEDSIKKNIVLYKKYCLKFGV